MTQPAISVQGLGKRYQIGGPRAPYRTLRETLVEAAGAPIRRLRQLQGKDEQARHIWALKDVSFDVQPGEVVGIIGRNGAGKSTLLKILSRITEPTEGRVVTRGRIGSLLEVGTGFHPELTGRENIFLNGAILGMTRKEIARKFDEIVAFAEIEDFLDTPVKRYSSGMYVRLAFAVAAHLEPEILVVDEVLAVGDAAFQKKCLGKMGEVAGEGRTVLFVSHNMGAVNALCRYAVMLQDGQIAFRGPARKAVNRYMAGPGLSGQQPAFRCTPNQEIPIQVIAGSVHNSAGQLQQVFDVFESPTIVLEYEVHTPREGLVVNFELVKNGDVVLTSFDTDTEQGCSRARTTGKFRAAIQLPSPLLKPGLYSVNINSGIANMKTYERIESALGFEITLASISDSLHSAAGKRPGVIATHLPWKVSQVPSSQ